MGDPGRDAEGRTQRERMMAGEPYLADDPELSAEHTRARRLQDELDRVAPDDDAGHRRVLVELLGAVGERTSIRPPLLDVAAITVVLAGVSVGDDTVVGAGAVVVDDLPAGVVAVGNPARIVRQVGRR